ncbi:MAG: tetratricopeptide repeat protein [Myxococcota bacterium]
MTDHDTDPRAAQAQTLIDDEAYEEALGLLEGAEDPELVRLRAEALMELEEFEEAEEEWDSLDLSFEEPGTDARPWSLRGFLSYYLDEAEEAKAAFDQALKLDGHHVRSMLGRSLVLREMEFDRAALLDLDRALMVLEDADEGDEKAQAFRGETHNLKATYALDDEDYEAAEQHLRNACKANPDDPEYLLDLARLLSLTGRVEDAMTTAHQASELDELLLQAHLLRSQLLGLNGRSAEAVQVARDTIELDDEEPYSWLQLAAALTLRNDHEGALEAAERAIALDDELIDGHQLRVASLQALGREVELSAELRARLSEPPDLPDFLYGDRFDPYEQAQDALQEMADMSPDQIKELTDEVFNMLGLPPQLRPMVESMMENLPSMLQQYPGLAKGQIPPDLMSSLGGMMPPMGAMPSAPAAGRPNLTVISGGKDDPSND